MSNAIDTIDRSVRNWHRAGALVAGLAAIVMMLLFTRTASAAVRVLEDGGPTGTTATTGASQPSENQASRSFALQAVDPCVNEATVKRISIPKGSPVSDPLVVVNMTSNGHTTTVDTLPFEITSTSTRKVEAAYCLDIEKQYVDGRTHCLDPNLITDWRLTYVLTYYPPEFLDAEVQAARQAAVWHYSNGYDLVRPDATTGDAGQDQRVLAFYDAILAEVDALPSPPPVFTAGEVALAVAPKSATNTLPGEAVHPFTVTLTKGGQPLPGYLVSVATSFGALNTATQVTDANGQASFTVTSNVAGTAQITATATITLPTSARFIEQQLADELQPVGYGKPVPVTVTDTASKTWVAPEPAELGDYVWLDTNVNGIQDETGTGVQGVTVNLYGNGTCTGQAIGTQQTDANGFYLFTGLQPGTYCVEFEKPAGFNFSPQNQGADDTKDSDADTSTGRTTAITLVAGQSDRTWDAGLYQPAPEPAELGDYVWEDTNGNGIQDETGTGVPGVTVRLYADCTGQAIDSQQTDANGFYLFTGLQPGTYCVEFEKPAGYEITGQNQGSDDTKDSDADILTGRTQPTTLTPGESDLTWDAGLYRPAALGDRVWVDLDFESQDVLSGDGMQNKDGQGKYMEKGVPTVTVELYANGDCTGDPLAVQQTDENGNYLFTGLKPGQYCVVFRLPQGVLGIWTTPNIGPGDSDSDAITPDDALDTARKTISISLESGETDLTWDAGLIRLSGLGSSAVGDRVWLDNNKNGIQDDGEPDFTLPLTVQLLTPGDDTPLQTITTQGGFYLFDGLDSGIYCVQFQIPTGYVVTNPNQGGSGNVDSDVDPTGRTICFQLPDLTTDLTWDMGLYTTPTDLPVSEEPAATDVRIFLPTVIRQ